MNDSTQKPGCGEFRDENHDGSHSETEREDVHMRTPKVRTWDVLQGHPIAQKLDTKTQLAFVCEFLDLYEDPPGTSLSDYIDAYFANTEGDAPAAAEAEADEEVEARADALDWAEVDEDDEDEPSANRDGEPRPPSMVGMRVVYRTGAGRNILSDKNGVTSDEIVGGFWGDSDRTVAFTDVDGEEWSNARRINVYPIKPENYRVIHLLPREARNAKKWLEGKKPVEGYEENAVLLNASVEFPDHPDKIKIVIINGKKRPYVDRFVEKPEGGFEDDQKPTERLMGEHCFRVKGQDYVVKVVSP
jgi:hypothetical protein